LSKMEAEHSKATEPILLRSLLEYQNAVGGSW
jgi:hypothetical protein